VAGAGLPQLSAVLKLAALISGRYRQRGETPGDVAKAIAAGASIVMVASILAGTEETPGDIVGNRKYVRGQASSDYMKDNHIATGEYRAAEGIVTTVPIKGSAMAIFQQIAGGLRSAMSYTGATTIKEFQKKAIFAIVSDAAKREARPHILE
jgi:IMP dehydrogenase/GMP reductase